jgi:hypothetical protein
MRHYKTALFFLTPFLTGVRFLLSSSGFLRNLPESIY